MYLPAVGVTLDWVVSAADAAGAAAGGDAAGDDGATGDGDGAAGGDCAAGSGAAGETVETRRHRSVAGTDGYNSPVATPSRRRRQL